MKMVEKIILLSFWFVLIKHIGKCIEGFSYKERREAFLHKLVCFSRHFCVAGKVKGI